MIEEARNTRQQLPGRSHAALRDACSATHTFRKRSKVEWTGEEYEEAVVRTRAGIIRVPASIISQSRSAPGGGRKYTRALPAPPTSTAAWRTFVRTRRPMHKAALRSWRRARLPPDLTGGSCGERDSPSDLTGGSCGERDSPSDLTGGSCGGRDSPSDLTGGRGAGGPRGPRAPPPRG